MGLRDLLAQRGALFPDDEERLAIALDAGPWCWPADGDGRQAATACGFHEPPAAQKGLIPLVTDSDFGSALWLEDRDPSLEGLRLNTGKEADLAWKDAVKAVPLAVPYVLRLPSGWSRAPEGLVRIAEAPKEGQDPTPGEVVDGPSFGLGFLLGRASVLMDHALPVGFAASAEVDTDGELRKVDGLEGKVRVVGSWACGVHTLLVCEEQREDWVGAVKAQGLELEVEGFQTARDAVEFVLGELVKERIVAAGPREQHLLCEQVFEISLGDAGRLRCWDGVANAAELALQCWRPGRDSPDGYRLRFAHAVASRHEGRKVTLGLPPESLLVPRDAGGPLLRDHRVAMVANLMQHASDTGTPDPDTVASLARGVIAGGKDSRPVMRLQGALGRHEAFQGRFEEALALQMEAAEYWRILRAAKDISFPLAEFYRLTTCVPRERGLELFAQADGLYLPLGKHDITEHGRSFVELSRARALVWLGRLDRRSRRFLDRSVAESAHAKHPRLSAFRLLIRHLDTEAGGQGSQALVDTLRKLEEQQDPSGRRWLYSTLVALDRAVAADDAISAWRAVSRLLVLRHAIVAGLLAAKEDPAFVAMAFPY